MRKLTFEKIKAVTVGAARIESQEDGIHFYRFTQQQQAAYQKRPSGAFEKTFASAGIRLEFVTDSRELSMETVHHAASSRSFLYIDLYCNGRLLAHIGSERSNSGVFGGTYSLGEGIKTVQIYFPWSASTVLRFLALDDSSDVTPISKAHRMLSFGDSITHGYDAHYPSHSYASVLADRLCADARNKGIGGERFYPPLLNEADENDPDIITVAYGTNDWSNDTPEDIEKNMKGFYSRLSELYPNAKIFAITPIWRKNEFDYKIAGSFAHIANLIADFASTLPNVTVIRGYDLVPHDPMLFADERLHPNDAGFAYYAERLSTEILKNL